MPEPMVITLQAPTTCAKCGATLNAGEQVRAYARRDGTWAIYCLGEHKAPSPSPSPRGGQGRGRPSSPPSPFPASPSPSPSSASPSEAQDKALEALYAELQALRGIHAELVELRKAVEGITAAVLSLVEVVNNHALATGQWLDLVQKAIRESK